MVSYGDTSNIFGRKTQEQIDQEDLDEMIKEKREFEQWQRRLLIAEEQKLNHKADYRFNEKYERWEAVI